MTKTPVASDMGMEIALNSDQVNAIQWIVPAKFILCGTQGGEWTIGGGTQGDPLTPTNVHARRHSNFGSATIKPQLIGNDSLYISRDGKKVREMSFSFETDSFVSPELSLLAEHIAREAGGIKSYSYAQSPDGVIWFVLNDGSIAAMTYLKSQDVICWQRQETQGTVKSVTVIESESYSEVWFATVRNGATRIERLVEQFDGTSTNTIACNYLDSSLTLDTTGTPVTVLSGLTHLEGMEVSVLADGNWQSNKTVSGGSITLDSPSEIIVVGLSSEWEMTPMKPEVQGPSGTAQGRIKRTIKFTLRLHKSLGIKYSLYEGSEYLLPDRTYGEAFDSEPSLFTGDKEVTLPGNWDRDGRFNIKGDSPFPVTILALIPDVIINE